MKKSVSILFIALLTLSGMHLSLATHFCMGEFATAKISFSGEAATCGMDTQGMHCPDYDKNISSNCCQNEITTYSTDNLFETISFQTKKVIVYSPEFNFPVCNLRYYIPPFISLKPDIVPPDIGEVSEVSLADICILLI